MDSTIKNDTDPLAGLALAGSWASEPKKVSADQDLKGVIANYRNFSKDPHDRSMRHRERGNACEHFWPTIGQSRGAGRDFPDKEGAASAGGLI